MQGYYLVGRNTSAQFTGWTVAGNFMGEHHPDTVRKIYNEGGLYGEVNYRHINLQLVCEHLNVLAAQRMALAGIR